MTSCPYINDSKFYNPNDYGWSIEESFAFPPGKYFLGDPVHALTESQYREACEINYNNCGKVDGVGELAVFKCPGDGVFLDEDGCSYVVSSGTLGVVPIGNASPDEIARLSSLGKVLEVPGDAGNPNWEDDGEGFSAMIDSQGHIYLGSAWIFCGHEHPLKAEFWKFLEDLQLITEVDFWPSEVNKVWKESSAYYYGWCESDDIKKCFIIHASPTKPSLKLGPDREFRNHTARLPGYTDPDFEDQWLELTAFQGISALA